MRKTWGIRKVRKAMPKRTRHQKILILLMPLMRTPGIKILVIPSAHYVKGLAIAPIVMEAPVPTATEQER